MRKERFIYSIVVLLCTLYSIVPSFAQTDSLNSKNDTIIDSKLPDTTKNKIISNDTLPSFPQNRASDRDKGYQEFSFDIAEDGLNSAIDYEAVDSFKVVIPLKTIFLYGQAHVVFEDFDLRAERVEFNWEKGEVFAHGVYDKKTNRIIGKPEFIQGGKTYLAEELRYNFNSKKGRSKGLVTQESEGFLHGVEIKSIGEDILYGEKVKYTTCDYEDPHFHLEVSKAKIVKDKVIVGKPVNLVVGDVHTPIILPFGIFPMQKNRVSGIIFPQYGYAPEQGIYLTNGGYYWAINDNWDLAATGSIFSRGQWSLRTDMNFFKKYKYRGNIGLSFTSTPNGEKRDPDYSGPRRNFNINTDFTLDPKRLYNSSFTVSIDGGTSGFNQVEREIDARLQTELRSSISYQKWWPGTPFRLSINAQHNQNTQSRTVNVTIPELSFAMSTIKPFQRKVSIGGEKWYEKINLSYNLNTRNSFRGIDSTFFTRETLEDAQNGVNHRVNVNLPFKIFKYFTFNAGMRYNDRWYFKTAVKRYNIVENKEETEFIREFRSARDYSFTGSMNWRLYGTFNFKKTKRVKAFRHVMYPTLSFNYRPDFSKDRYNYFDTYINRNGVEEEYSLFQGAIYGAPSAGSQGSIAFNLGNDFEMKVLSRKDSVPKEKKIDLLDNFRIGANYNFFAEQFKLSRINLTGSTRILNIISINFNGVLDPYYTDPETNIREDRFLFSETKRFVRLTSFNTSVSGTFRGKKKKGGERDDTRTGRNVEYQSGLGYDDVTRYLDEPRDPENRELSITNPFTGTTLTYLDFDVPWSLTPSYNMRLNRSFSNGRDTVSLTQSARLRGSLGLTKNWQFTVNTGYDITNKKWNSTAFTLSRDLHCWQLAFTWQLAGVNTSYAITFNVKSQMLKFLQLNRRNGIYDNNLLGGFP